jgi:hypothetical protein
MKTLSSPLSPVVGPGLANANPQLPVPNPTPSCPAADRNLLFGILALQMDFISRDALIQAMNAWTLDKPKPLGQILVEHGALRPEKRDLLETLVQASQIFPTQPCPRSCAPAIGFQLVASGWRPFRPSASMIDPRLDLAQSPAHRDSRNS